MECRLLYLVGQLGLGGLERQLFYLIRCMDRRRYKPVVAIWSNSADDHYARDLHALGVPVVPLGNNPGRSAKLKALRCLVSGLSPEVIHSYTYYTNIAAWLSARRTKSIAIGSVRNDFVLDRRAAGKVLGRLCGRWPSGQIFNSFNAKQEAMRSTTIFKPPRIYVVTNGIDLDRFSARPFPGQGYILAVGSLNERKRWDRLLRAVGFLVRRRVALDVRHAGSGPLQEELEGIASSLEIERQFQFLGARNDIPDLLANATLLVHTAENEGCPNVVMEAMACGRAVVATDAGDVRHLVEDGKTGFVVPRDDESVLAERIATLLDDRDLCRRMGDAGRTRAEQLFGLERLLSETFSAYRAEGWKDS